jgi:DIE2/ALG10 family protein
VQVLSSTPPLGVQRAAVRPASHGRASLLVGLLGVAAWWAVACALHPDVIVDELDHYAVIRDLKQGSSPLARELPMPLTYHWLVRGLLWPWEPPLWSARALSAVFSCVGLWALDAAIRRDATRAAERPRALAHFAWLPLLFPYQALVYTEPLAVPCVALALLARSSGRAWLAAAALLGSCLVRQSHVVWLAFFCLWELAERWPSLPVGGPRRAAVALKTSLPFVLAAGVMLGLFAARGSLSFSNLPENDAGFNPGQFYLFGGFMLLLWAPVWVLRAPLAWAALESWGRARPLRAASYATAVLGGALLAAATYRNLNEWNALPEFVGNWPLIWMDRYVVVAFGVILCDAAAVALLIWHGRAQEQRGMLAVALLVTLIYLGAQSLIDPRYFIVPVMLAHWLSRFSPRESRWLGLWYAVLSLAISAVVLLGGMW